ncbi:MAG TPA: N-6 DNA methylase, partial [Candidatus Acidoferrales bacterium]|nr:N-6 DNA methylase [Candidatus Acidoferrales bacterium]
YDTEIFSARVWVRLDKDPANLQRFCEKLNFILGINTWDQTFGTRGIVHYNYRRIDEDIFGKSYEMFLAANRKDEGIYYTPAGITGPMADSLVNSLAGKIVDEICEAVGTQKCDFKRADKLMAQLFEIRVADTACGSGGFLIKALRSFWQQYQRIDAACFWVQKIIKPDNGEMYLAEMPPNVEAALDFRRRQNLDNRRILIAQILLRHIFGVDKDPGAIEVAKTNIWKEAVKLSPADYNYRLLKTDVVKILPNLELNFHCTDSLVDVELPKQTEWLAEYHQAELKKLSELRARYIENPMKHEALDEALALRKKIRADLIEHFQGENLPCEPGGFALHFWSCWFTPEGRPVKTSGFDGVIGNPPWEGFKPIAKEFAANFYRDKPQFSKMGMDGPAFEKWLSEELKTNIEFAARWREHGEYYERYKEFFGRTYKRQGTGDWNLFKLFIERDLSLVRQGGQFSLLVPSGFQTDEGCADLRRWFITEHRLDELTSFENKGWQELDDQGKEKRKQIFPDVHPQFKFGFFKLEKNGKTTAAHTFKARFYLHDPKDVFEKPVLFAVRMIPQFSPKNFAFMEFRSPEDYRLCSSIRGNNKLLYELGFQFRREFHMTGDAELFHKSNGVKLAKEQLVLFEGKLIHQFDSSFSSASHFVIEKDGRSELLRKEIFRLAQFVRDSKSPRLEGKPVPAVKADLEARLMSTFKSRQFKLHYEYPRLAYRSVGRTTDERTLIASIVPAKAFMAHSLYYLVPVSYELSKAGELKQNLHDHSEIAAVLALLNSLTLNFYIRSKVSANLNISSVEELPIPPLADAQKKKLADAATTLLKDPHDVKERATLEVFIARELYGLSLDDWKHLTGTFTFGSGESKAELDEIIRQSLVAYGQ